MGKTKKAAPVIPPETTSLLVEAIRQSPEPLKAAPLVKQIGIKALKGPKVVELLHPELASGRLFNWGTAKTPAYWHRDAADVAKERLLSVAANSMPSAAELTKRAASGSPKLAAAAVKKVQAALIEEKRLRLVEKKLVDTQRPERYLETKIADLLRDWGREAPPARIQALFSSDSSHSVQEAADKLFAAMNRIAVSPGTTVTFYRLRQQPELADIPKAIFDAAALHLQQQRKALLSVHDHASALLPEEREPFVTDGLGTYYVSIYAR